MPCQCNSSNIPLVFNSCILCFNVRSQVKNFKKLLLEMFFASVRKQELGITLIAISGELRFWRIIVKYGKINEIRTKYLGFECRK